MKSILLSIILLAFFMLGCNLTGVQLYEDAYKGATYRTINQQYATKTQLTGMNYGNFLFQTIEKENFQKHQVYVTVNRGRSSFRIENEGVFAYGDQFYPLKIEYLESTNLSTTNTSTCVEVKTGSTGTSTNTIEDSSTSNWTEDKFKFELTDEIVELIGNGKQPIYFQFYSAEIPIVFSVPSWKAYNLNFWAKPRVKN